LWVVAGIIDMCRMNINRVWVYIKLGSEVVRAFVVWPPWLYSQ
jgi:hypothetical protein